MRQFNLQEYLDNLNWDFITGEIIPEEEHYCGLHGCARVDPEGEQQDLDHQGSCGFLPIKEPRQTRLAFYE